ncbi:hypothetical protein H072_6890 [Dactylellina haptotyla CBS 200.50]|uniref:UV-damage endonuclease n=1 Tax=Dactylellina haptotyla (strain CBS 200.50) TaxID=1284197 RepID=S8A8H4_DACHA|nr:hypothetical protein H072_6890 [Dactylellina haptotyla CBS 200.50]
MPRGRKKLEILPATVANSNTSASAKPAHRLSRTASSKAVNYAVDEQSSPDPDIVDGENALRASPSAVDDLAFSPGSEDEGEIIKLENPKTTKKSKSASKPPKTPSTEKSPAKIKKLVGKKRKINEASASGDEEFKVEEGDEAEGATERPPAVNDEYRPIPFKGRLGFACLNTYLRTCVNPVFCSRTCRLDTIHKHDKESGAGAGLEYVKSLGFANATDLGTLIRWNHKYNIKFLRISSEMFPFASHAQYGYDLAHAASPLKEAGRLAMQYGHRLTMHPGQFTQLGSPRPEVVENAIRDLEYHCELLDRLQLTGQTDRDAVMIIHMGGIFGDKNATLDRFRKVYTTRLSDGIKRRLVLENDDVCWSVEDLLPICQELSIPLVLDWHHNNIVHGNLREGTYDVRKIHGEAIKKTWTDKGITQKQHYSEPRAGSITNKDRRRHSPRVVDLPPCEDTMDLMIEAKDKEQAVFELMRKFKLDGWEKLADVVPYERDDENKVETKKKKGEEEVVAHLIPSEDIGMGGKNNRVYWPEGMEEYLKPKKKVRAKKEDATEDGPVVKSTKPVKKAVKSDRTEASKVASKKARLVKVEKAETETTNEIDQDHIAPISNKKRRPNPVSPEVQDEIALQIQRESKIKSTQAPEPTLIKRGRKPGSTKKQITEEETPAVEERGRSRRSTRIRT